MRLLVFHNHYDHFVLFCLPIGQIWGNLISSLVFSERGEDAATEVSDEALQKCGANNCFDDDISNNTNLKKPELKQVSGNGDIRECVNN